jgi:hypothetical protein
LFNVRAHSQVRQLPRDLELVSEEFGKGLSFVLSGHSQSLDKEIRALRMAFHLDY